MFYSWLAVLDGKMATRSAITSLFKQILARYEDMKDHLVVSFCLLVPVARNSSVYTQASMYVYLLYTLGREAVEKECR